MPSARCVLRPRMRAPARRHGSSSSLPSCGCAVGAAWHAHATLRSALTLRMAAILLLQQRGRQGQHIADPAARSSRLPAGALPAAGAGTCARPAVLDLQGRAGGGAEAAAAAADTGAAGAGGRGAAAAAARGAGDGGHRRAEPDGSLSLGGRSVPAPTGLGAANPAGERPAPPAGAGQRDLGRRPGPVRPRRTASHANTWPAPPVCHDIAGGAVNPGLADRRVVGRSPALS